MASQVAKFVEKSEFDWSSDPLDFKTTEMLHSSQTRIPRDFTITTDSYISLCSRVYNACCSVSDDFARTFSESVFQYYAVIVLWKRFAQILSSSEKNGSEFFTELEHECNTCSYWVPLPLHTYLKGIGHFRDPDVDCNRRFVLPVFPTTEKIGGFPYTFGRVNAETHFFYEALPAPGIAALRIQADIRYTKDPCEKNILWDLPEGLRPDIQNSDIESVKPTRNLLGWAPAQRLTESQLQLLKTSKLDDAATTSSTILIPDLCEELNDKFSNWGRNKYDLMTDSSVGLSVKGSVVQGMTIEKHCDDSKFDRSTMYCEGNMSVSSPYKSNSTLNNGAVISGYRMAREPIGATHCWSCYDFNEYKNVPESWIRTRNTIYTYGNIGKLNESVYTTGHISKRVLQNECIQHIMFKNSEKWNVLH